MVPPGSQTAYISAAYALTGAVDEDGIVIVNPNNTLSQNGGRALVTQSGINGAVFDLWLPGLTLADGDVMFISGSLQAYVVGAGGRTVSDFGNTMDLQLLLPEGFEGEFFDYETGAAFDPAWLVPEPSPAWLIGVLLGLVGVSRRRSTA
jgi:hypothetical protein